MKHVNAFIRWLTVCVAMYSAQALATAEDVLEPINEKAESIIDPLTMFGGTLAVLGMVLVAVMFMFGKVPKFLAGCIVAGCAVLLTASLIGNFLLA